LDKEIYNKTANLFVAGFMGSPAMNMGKASCMAAEGGSILRLGGSAGAQASIAARVDRDEVILGLRPEDISLTTPDRAKADGEFRFAGRVAMVEPMGAEDKSDRNGAGS